MKQPEYFHKVVDCQYACPAHTPVPQYIRMIGEGRYSDAYMLNRESNVFPGILGRVCDRPCEPACRRGRVEEKPVAICRLKRAAADFKSDIRERLPSIPTQKNGKKVALIGAGPASLTVANDLMPLGYHCTLYEKERQPGGAMLTQVPGFRLPQTVLDEEIGYILSMGVEARFGEEVKSLKSLLAQGYDAVFVGTGAPVGKDLLISGRKEAKAGIHIGLEFLANVHFQHLQAVKKQVLIIGGGNTAMDCCRTALRLGADQVKVVAPEAYGEMLASPWEKEDAEGEGVSFHNNLLPQEFLHEQGRLVGVRFQVLKQCYNREKKWEPIPSGEPDVILPCDEVVLAIGQLLSFPFVEEELGLFTPESLKSGYPKADVDKVTFQAGRSRVFFGGDAAFGPKNIIWAVAHGHEAAISIHAFCQGLDVRNRPEQGMNLVSQKMAMNQWSYSNGFSEQLRLPVPHADLQKRVKTLALEVEKGYDAELASKEVERCLNCDVQTVFHNDLCIECDACVDICPVACLTLAEKDEDEGALRLKLTLPALNKDQALFQAEVPQTKRVMVKDENLCVHCGLCAERCPTAAWDMQAFTLILPHAKDLLSCSAQR